MTTLAVLRPSDWEMPLFLHVLGAMILVGGLVAVLAALVLAWRRRGADDVAGVVRLGFRSLLFIVVPGFLLMRIAAEWVRVEEFGGGPGEEPGWIGVGYITSDFGLVLLVVALVLGGLATRRARRGGGFGVTGQVTAVITALLLIAYLVAVWAMTAKPG